MPRSTKAASDRRLEFIDTAEALFNEKGFENTSIDDIVQRVGVAKGLFYYYFKSREELLATIVDRILDEMQHIVAEAVNRGIDGHAEALCHDAPHGYDQGARGKDDAVLPRGAQPGREVRTWSTESYPRDDGEADMASQPGRGPRVSCPTPSVPELRKLVQTKGPDRTPRHGLENSSPRFAKA